MFRTILVLDLYDKKVVHAQGGDRKKYLPVHLNSTICNTSDPLQIVKKLKPKEVYIADLNLLQHKGLHQINFPIIKQISLYTTVMLDAGIKTCEDMLEAISITDTIILGTETASLQLFKEITTLFPGKINISLDKKYDKVLSNDPLMPKDPFLLLEEINKLDIKNIIILDLDRVGTSNGIDLQFLSKIVNISKHAVLLGGGLKSCEDIVTLEQIGIQGALIATALHNGNIPVNSIV